MSTDAVLQQRWIQQRDADAFAELVSRYGGVVFGACVRVLQNAHDAEEVAQECFLTLASQRRPIEPHLAGWLHTLAFRRAVDRRRSQAGRARREAAFAEQSGETGVPRWDDIAPMVDEAIAALPPKLREPILRRFVQGETHEAISRDLGVARTTITYRIDQGVARVRSYLRREGVQVAPALLPSLFAQHLPSAPPSTLVATLGKAALAGMASGTGMTATGAMALTGGVLMAKKAAITAAALVILGSLGTGWYWAQSPKAAPKLPEPTTVAPKIVAPPASPEEPAAQAAPAPKSEPEPPSEPERDEPAETDASDDMDLVVSGKVIDAAGKPVEGAHVVAGWVSAKAKESREALSQADGSFEVRAPKDWPHKMMDLAAGAYKAGQGQAFAEGLDYGARGVILRLQGGAATIAGRVSGRESGGGVRGAVVAAYPVAETASLEAQFLAKELLRTETGSEGDYVLAVTAPGRYRVAVVEARGYTDAPAHPEAVQVYPGAEETGIDFVLEQGASILGKVRGRDGEKPDAEAQLIDLATRTFDKTDIADGVFEFNGLQPGPYEIVIDGGPVGSTRSETITLKSPGEVKLVELQLGAGIVLEGKVTDEDGVLIEGAKVRLSASVRDANWALSTDYAHSEPTDREGRFLFEGVVPGEYSYGVEAEGCHLNSNQWTILPEPQHQTRSIELLRKREGVIAGMVMTDAGEPVPNSPVLAMHRTGNTNVLERTMTDSTGRFRFESLGAFGTWMLFAMAAGRERVMLQDVALGKVDVELIAKGNGMVRGVVTDAHTGRPIESFAVRIAARRQPDGSRGHVLSKAWTTFSDPDGRFALADLPAGEVQLAAKAPGYAVAASDWLASSADGSGPEAAIALKPGAAVEGTVRNVEGQPIAGARVSVRSGVYGQPGMQSGAGSYEVTDAEGRFRIDSLPPLTPVTLGAQAEGYGASEQQAPVPNVGQTGTAEFVLYPEAHIVVHVYFDGTPLSGALVALKPQEVEVWSTWSINPAFATSDEDGKARLSALGPGTYDLQAAKVSGGKVLGKATGSAAVEPGETVSVVLEIQPLKDTEE